MTAALPPGETRSTCCYCGVGCGVIIETRETRMARARSSACAETPSIRPISGGCAPRGPRCI
ncbi:MAG: hypothetical protein WDN30_02505 [Pararobbsia sp.]